MIPDQELVKIAIDHGFGCDMEEEPGYPDVALWYDTNPMDMLRAVVAIAEKREADRIMVALEPFLLIDSWGGNRYSIVQSQFNQIIAHGHSEDIRP